MTSVVLRELIPIGVLLGRMYFGGLWLGRCGELDSVLGGEVARQVRALRAEKRQVNTYYSPSLACMG